MNYQNVVSVSGGQSSAYIAANYPFDYAVFSLVRIEDPKCRFPDETLRKRVEDRLQMPFIGTAEDDTIIYTIFDLEQFIGRPIKWVSGITFDEVIRTKCGWLPNKKHRYCTTHLKIDPIFYWWADQISEPVNMLIGYRAGENKRVDKMKAKLNPNGLLEFKATFEKHTTGSYKGKNKWEVIEWQIPCFPMVSDNIYKDHVYNFWQGKPVRFAPRNNCVGCFHRNPILLRKMYEYHPQKMEWFASKEGGKNGFWRSDLSYKKIFKHNLQLELSYDDFSRCDDGFCGL